MESRIPGVVITSLRRIPDERGSIYHIFKSTEPDFDQFGEVYLSHAYPGVVKGWHLHTKQTQNYVVIKGMIKLVLYDMREEGTFKQIEEYFFGDLNYCRIRIPPGVANGYKCIGTDTCTVLNLSDLPHMANEMLRMEPDDKSIGYSWGIVMK